MGQSNCLKSDIHRLTELTHGEIVGQGSQLHGNRQNNKTQAVQHSPVGRILGSV